MLEYELCNEKSTYNSKNPKNVLDELGKSISYINDLKIKLKNYETDIDNKTVMYGLIGTFIAGALITYIGDINILPRKESASDLLHYTINSFVGALGSLLLICTPLAFVLEKYKEKFYSFFNKRVSLKNELLNQEKYFLDSIKNPEIKRIVISELQDIAKLLKDECNNVNFENHFAGLIKSLLNDDYEHLKNDLLKNFHHWQNVKRNTLKQKEEGKVDKANHDKFLISIGVEPTNSVEKVTTPKDIKSML